ncbi:MAG TPA: DHA2 family efflux MFS transporter permease subunit, partial [Vicinamibacteria bacterium]|nr:DHA2 family efflux MFS transporter permease subunit [Vicinamibacteria bacterium]
SPAETQLRALGASLAEREASQTHLRRRLLPRPSGFASVAEATHPSTIGAARRWMITGTVMLVTIMQVLDVTVTNVALPHIQGSLSAGVDEVSWVLTSYLAANAVVLPATGWLAGLLGRRRFFLICTVVFTAASVLCGLAPNLPVLLLARVLQGIGGGPLMPLSQAIMWEIFPLRNRGTAMAVWGIGIMMAPIFGPTLGGWIADNWSWRWIFYINIPFGIFGFLAASVVLFDPPYLRRSTRADVPGLLFMVVGFLSLQLFLDQGERSEWFDSSFIVAMAVLAAVALTGFFVRQLTAEEPIMDFGVYRDRNFAMGSLLMAVMMVGFFSSMLLLALYTQKVLGYDAWTSGLVLAPGGLGNLLSLVVAGRLVARVDMRWMLAVGCLLNAWSAYSMSTLTLGMDYWTLAWPRFVQGLGVGFVFLPLNALALATVPREKMGNATAAINVVRNIGGSVGVAMVSTLLARRSQEHHATLVSHVNVWDPETVGRLAAWTDRFAAQGADAHTAQRRALVALSNEVTRQAQVLAFADDFWLLFVLFTSGMLLLPLLRRVVIDPAPSAEERADAVPGLPVE